MDVSTRLKIVLKKVLLHEQNEVSWPRVLAKTPLHCPMFLLSTLSKLQHELRETFENWERRGTESWYYCTKSMPRAELQWRLSRDSDSWSPLNSSILTITIDWKIRLTSCVTAGLQSLSLSHCRGLNWRDHQPTHHPLTPRPPWPGRWSLI